MQFGCKGSKNIAYLQIFVEFSVFMRFAGRMFLPFFNIKIIFLYKLFAYMAKKQYFCSQFCKLPY